MPSGSCQPLVPRCLGSCCLLVPSPLRSCQSRFPLPEGLKPCDSQLPRFLCLGSFASVPLPAIPAQLVGSSLPLDSSTTDFGLRPNRSVSKYGAVTLRGMNTTYVHEGSPVCLHSWPRDLVGWNQSSWKRFRVLKRARVFKIRMVALQGWRHRDAILCRGGQTPCPHSVGLTSSSQPTLPLPKCQRRLTASSAAVETAGRPAPPGPW